MSLLHPDDEVVEVSEAEEKALSFFPSMRPSKPEAAELPKAVSELRGAPERVMFSARSMYGNSVKLEEAPLDASPEMRAAVEAYNREALEIFQDLEMSAPEAQQVTELFQRHTATPPDATTMMQWRAEAGQEIQRRYGDEAQETLALARALVQRDPRVAQLLDATGLGNHPRVVELLCEKARSMRFRLAKRN